MTSFDADLVQVGRIVVSPQHNSLTRHENIVKVQPRVMAVLIYLATHADRVISSDELLEQVWEGRVVTPGSVQKSINSLRTALARLDDQEEYVVHFSKRGYQMAVPVSYPKEIVDQGSTASRTLSPFRAGLILLFFCFVVTVAIFGWRARFQLAEPEWEVPAYTYADPALLIRGVGDVRAAEPHPSSGKIAFIRDLMTEPDNRVRSELIVRSPNGDEWQLSIASSTYVNLAWSPSGRNLLALEADGVAGVGDESSYSSPADEYFTFHIFTLDFKGERLLEKNLLSHWQGKVRSLYWRDDNTLEFIASQGFRPDMERYQYRVPTQKLIRLQAPENSQKLLLGDRHGNRTALATVRDNQYHLLFLDQSEAVIGDIPLHFMPRDMEWLPDGSAVAMLATTGNRLEIKTLQGGGRIFDLGSDLGREFEGRIQRIRFMGDGPDLLATVVYPKTTLEWSPMTETAPLTLLEAPEITAAQTNYDGSGFYVAVPKQGKKTELVLLKNNESVAMPEIPEAIERIDAIISSADASGLYFQSGRELWHYQFDEGQSEKKYTSNKDMAVIAVNDQKAWAVVEEGGVKNIWRLSLDEGKAEDRQLTFGSIGSALASEGTLYFQYQSKSGLWQLDMLTDRMEQVTANLAQNVRLLAARNREIYFVRGSPCRESPIYALHLDTGEVLVVSARSNPNVHTLDLNPDFGWLQQTCAEGETAILKFPRTDHTSTLLPAQ